MSKRVRDVLVAVGLSMVVFAVLAGAALLLVPRPPAGTELRDLASVEDLRNRFNADQGVTRLVLVLSPT